jgi:hypothetical protein
MTGQGVSLVVASAAYFVGQVIAWVIMGSFVGAILFVTWRQSTAFKIAKQRFAGRQTHRIELDARFFGHSVLGRVQWRGPGVIVLAPDVLWYRLGFPGREFEIPLDAIRVVDVRRTHLGIPSRRPLLFVEAELGGKIESFAWQIDKPEHWLGMIQHTIATRRASQHAAGSPATYDPAFQPPAP